jgi:hypothetical protein
MEGQMRRLPVRLKAGLPRGVMGLPVSLGNLPAWPLGEVWATIRPETDEDRQAG